MLKRFLRVVIPLAVRLWLLRVPATLRWLLLARPPRQSARSEHIITERHSPLRRSKAVYDDHVQRAKEHNVTRVAALLDGTVIAPGATFSWHDTVGPPLALRGFQPGPELRGEQLSRGVGGGACQASNLLFWLAAHSGLTIVERHRHSLDLFPDDGRDVPFGCGATVLFPTRDLKLFNPHTHAVVLSFAVHEQALVGSVQCDEPMPFTYRLVERDARHETRAGETWRCNRLERQTLDASLRVVAVETLCENAGRVCYEPLPLVLQEIA